jgi:hypothetical protein
VAFVLGAAGLTTSALLLLTRPSSSGSASIVVTHEGAYVGWRGAF